MTATPILTRTTLACLTIFVMCGCASRSLPSAATPAPVELSIVYSTYGKCRPLSASQLREVTDILRDAARARRDAWFIDVSSNDEGKYRLSIYFRPSKNDGRVRHGEYFFVNSDSLSVEQHREAARSIGERWPALEQYVQVVAAGSVAGGPPSEAALPFSPCEKLSDGQLVDVIDAARSAAVETDPAAVKMPVRWIATEKNDEIQVYFGWQAGPLNGHGVFVTLKQQGSKFAVLGVGMWVS